MTMDNNEGVNEKRQRDGMKSVEETIPSMQNHNYAPRLYRPVGPNNAQSYLTPFGQNSFNGAAVPGQTSSQVQQHFRIGAVGPGQSSSHVHHPLNRTADPGQSSSQVQQHFRNGAVGPGQSSSHVHHLLNRAAEPGQSPSQVQQLLNRAATMKSVVSAVPEPQQRLHNTPPANERYPNESIDQILGLHYAQLRNALYGTVVNLAKEKSGALRRQKEHEILMKRIQMSEWEQKIASYTRDIDRLLDRLTSWDRVTESLQSSLEELTLDQAGSSEDKAEEKAESSDMAVEPVRLDCKVCEKYVATVMMWPCRHVCVCTACNEVSRVCPVCKAEKITTLELCYHTEV